MGDKTKVILLGGFLGAGKTTLLKHILGHQTGMSGTVVIINEFGKIGIDASLIKKEEADIIELTSGCVCCTLAVDLRITLEKVWREYNPQRIIIEASGIADTRSLISLFQEEGISSHLESICTVTVLDAGFWESRTILGEIFNAQLDPADLILLNKIDLLEIEKLRQYLKEVKEMFPLATVRPTVHCRIDPELILPGAETNENKRSRHEHSEGNEAKGDDKDFVTFSYQNSEAIDENRFKKFVNELPLNMFRMKGTVRFEDRTVMINHVGGASEWIDEKEKKETRLVFVGWNVSGDDILARLKRCLPAR